MSSTCARGDGVSRLAFVALSGLAIGFGLGDIAQVTPLDVAVLTGMRGLLPLTIGSALAATYLSGRTPAFPGRLALPATLWLGVLALSTALAPSNRLAALASLERPASGALLAWAVYDLSRDPRRWGLLIRLVALGGLAIALVGLAEASGLPSIREWLAALHDGSIPIGDIPRIASTLSHPNEAAILLELSLPLLLAWAWIARGPRRLLVAAGGLGTLIAIVLTFSRAGIIAALVELAVLAGVCVGRGERRPLLPLGIAALVVPAALLIEAVANPGLDHRLSAEMVPAAGATLNLGPQPTRLQFWTAALSMARDYPVLGVGPDNFRWRFATYSGMPQDNLGVHAHDQYLEALADTGLLGLLSLAWLLARLARVAANGARTSSSAGDWPWRAALLASLCGWLLHALLDDFERFWPASVAFWLLAGLTLRPGAERAR